MDDNIRIVLRWESERPRLIIGGRPATIDLVSGQRVGFPWTLFVAVDGGPVPATHTYGWTGACVGPYTSAETGDMRCKATQWRLLRVDLDSRSNDVVVSAGERPSIAVTADGRRLATGNSPGEFVAVKDLPVGPTANAP